MEERSGTGDASSRMAHNIKLTRLIVHQRLVGRKKPDAACRVCLERGTWDSVRDIQGGYDFPVLDIINPLRASSHRGIDVIANAFGQSEDHAQRFSLTGADGKKTAAR